MKKIICFFVLLILTGCADRKAYSEAQSLAAEGVYEEAVVILTGISDYKDSANLIGEYQEKGRLQEIEKVALDYFNKNQYVTCIQLLEDNNINNDFYEKACLENAKKFAQQKNYKSAITYLEKIPNNEDAKNLLPTYKLYMIYNNGVKKMKNGDLEEAIKLFESIDNKFENTNKYLKLCRANIVYIGRWEASSSSEFYRAKDGMYLTSGLGDNVIVEISITEDGKTHIRANGDLTNETNGTYKWVEEEYIYELNLSSGTVSKYKTVNPELFIITKLEKPTIYARYAYTGEPTLDQKNALEMAKRYVNVINFSRKGLIEQLEYEGFSKSDAIYAVDNLIINWEDQAYGTAKQYFRLFDFSGHELMEQLEYDGYTQYQAIKAAENCGLK